jgi:hypothetical protein
MDPDHLSDVMRTLHPLALVLVALLILLFRCVDKDHDGFISVNEIKAACAVDWDGDGVISEAEKNAGIGGMVQAVASLAGVEGDQKFSLRDLASCAGKVRAKMA